MSSDIPIWQKPSALGLRNAKKYQKLGNQSFAGNISIHFLASIIRVTVKSKESCKRCVAFCLHLSTKILKSLKLQRLFVKMMSLRHLKRLSTYLA